MSLKHNFRNGSYYLTGLPVFASVIVLSFFLPPTNVASAEELVLTDVPVYYWYHGCSPTSGGMLMGYWDSYGFPNLISGSSNWATNESNIENAIASPGHVSDYALYNGVDDYGRSHPYRDISSINPSAAHSNDCIADFMYTSRSSYGLTHGATYLVYIDGGLTNYAAYKGYSFTASAENYTPSSSSSWDNFAKEIQCGRPVLVNVDCSGDGQVDHSVAAIGYRITGGVQEYACWDTWYSTIRWEQFRAVSSSYSWGVNSTVKLRPANTWDTLWKVSAGNWSNSSSWSAGIPNVTAFVNVPGGTSATVDANAYAYMVTNAGNLNVNQNILTTRYLRNYKGNVSLADGVVNVSGNLFNDQGIVTGTGTITCPVINQGEIRPTVWNSTNTLNILGSLTGDGNVVVGDGAVLKLSDGGDIGGSVQMLGPGSALNLQGGTLTMSSAMELTGTFDIAKGAYARLSNLHVHGDGVLKMEIGYLESSFLTVDGNALLGGLLDLTLLGSRPREGDKYAVFTATSISGAFSTITSNITTGLLPGVPAFAGLVEGQIFDAVFQGLTGGDAQGDHKVNLGDLGILSANWGRVGGMSWSTGDFDGDGKVDLGDLGIMSNNWNWVMSSGAPGIPIPEPATMSMLFVAGLLLLRRRTR